MTRMTRVAISVEGLTELEFVNRVLANHLLSRKIETTPVSLNGNVTVERLASHMKRLFRSFNFVTSLVDFYGFRDRSSTIPVES